MANCPNCSKKLSCGCKKRTAKDGKTVCASCVAAYEAKLTTSKTTALPNNSRLLSNNRYTKK